MPSNALELYAQLSHTATVSFDRLAFIHDIANFLIRVDEWKELAQQGRLSAEQKEVLRRAKNAIAYFQQAIREFE